MRQSKRQPVINKHQNADCISLRFVGRYNTMIVFLFRPSPQVPRPSKRAAQQCFASSKFNIHMQHKQIETKSVEMTWIFIQSIFMAINTVLWTLSYYEIRQKHSRDEVEKDLKVAMTSIKKAIERWPGVASAYQLYSNLIDACLKIYEKDGDIPIAVGSPESTVDQSRSRTTSPAFIPPGAAPQLAQPAPPSSAASSEANTAFGYFIAEQPPAFGAEQFTPDATGKKADISNTQSSPPMSIFQSNGLSSPSSLEAPGRRGTDRTNSNTSYSGVSPMSFDSTFDPSAPFNPLPNTFQHLAVSWNPSFGLSSGQGAPTIPALSPFDQPMFNADGLQTNVPYSDYLYAPSWNMEVSRGAGLTQEQQSELMQDLEETGPSQINPMIQASNALFYPHGRSF